jgi:hypothetical protein
MPIADGRAAEMAGPDVYTFPAVDRWGYAPGSHISANHLGKLIAAALPDKWTATP